MESIRTTIEQLDKQSLSQLTTEQLSIERVDQIINELGQLIPEDFRAWHCSMLKRLGEFKYRELASQARQEGKVPAKYFSWLLKHAK